LSTASSQAQEQYWQARRLPAVEEVRPGLWSVPIPWPGSLGYTLAYVFASDQGAALIDTGWPSDQAWDALVSGLRDTGHDIGDIQHVLVTHAHGDHLGLAAKIRELSGASVGMHPAEAAALSEIDQPGLLERSAAWLRSCGAPAAEAAHIQNLTMQALAGHRQLAAPDTLIEHGDRPLAGVRLRAVWTPGHTPGHLCFYDEDRDLLLTGDHVLPRISPHIASNPGDDDPLGTYLVSLAELAAYEPAEVLPAHEYRFVGLGARIAELIAHHQERLAEVEHAVSCRPGLSTWQAASVLSWSRGWENTQGMARRAAVSETLAHLIRLARQQRVVNTGRGIDAWWPGSRATR
jgi:glyoxylase-like metal-dependent hydrolase (beta-lactamase superfamily II)